MVRGMIKQPQGGLAFSQNAVFDALALKQASLGTGTTAQFLRGDLSWQEVPTSVGIAQVKVVSKGGVDATGDGRVRRRGVAETRVPGPAPVRKRKRRVPSSERAR